MSCGMSRSRSIERQRRCKFTRKGKTAGNSIWYVLWCDLRLERKTGRSVVDLPVCYQPGNKKKRPYGRFFIGVFECPSVRAVGIALG